MSYIKFIIFWVLISNTALAVNQVIITGNTKTKREAILRWINIYPGKEISKEHLEESIEKLKRAWQFNLKKVVMKDKTLYIDIEEKWSIFPVPVINQSGE